MSLVQVEVDKIKVPPERVTSVFEPDILEEFKESVKQSGIKVPLLLMEVNGELWLIDGLHRLQAAKELGIKTVPAVIKHGDQADLMVENLIANRMRGRSNPAQEALLIKKLHDEQKWSWKEISRRLGMTPFTVKMYYELCSLPQQVLELVGMGKLSPRKAHMLLQIPDPRDQVKAAEDIVKYNYTEGQTKELVEHYLSAYMETPEQPQVPLKRPEAESWMHCELCNEPMKEKATYHWVDDGCWGYILALWELMKRMGWDWRYVLDILVEYAQELVKQEEEQKKEEKG